MISLRVAQENTLNYLNISDVTSSHSVPVWDIKDTEYVNQKRFVRPWVQISGQIYKTPSSRTYGFGCIVHRQRYSTKVCTGLHGWKQFIIMRTCAKTAAHLSSLSNDFIFSLPRATPIQPHRSTSVMNGRPVRQTHTWRRQNIQQAFVHVSI